MPASVVSMAKILIQNDVMMNEFFLNFWFEKVIITPAESLKGYKQFKRF